jgi:hypothetical protein
MAKKKTILEEKKEIHNATRRELRRAKYWDSVNNKKTKNNGEKKN